MGIHAQNHNRVLTQTTTHTRMQAYRHNTINPRAHAQHNTCALDSLAYGGIEDKRADVFRALGYPGNQEALRLLDLKLGK